MKRGIVEALDIAAICRAAHVPLMIGAMMESHLATSAAAYFVADLGGFQYINLDTPMLLAEDPFTGSYEQRGSVYDVSGIESGLGIERKSSQIRAASSLSKCCICFASCPDYLYRSNRDSPSPHNLIQQRQQILYTFLAIYDLYDQRQIV
jgi:hypothetical protein